MDFESLNILVMPQVMLKNVPLIISTKHIFLIINEVIIGLMLQKYLCMFSHNIR